ncbi:MAG: glycosyltransferase [Bacteroidota bacterium]
MQATNATKKDLISVVLPVFNGAKYLRTAVESILNQSYSDFELLVLDDASTDDTIAIIESYEDKRIRLLKAEKNEGIVARLNEGIRQAKGKYIARMDADDISMPHRLERQIQFLQTHSMVALVGSNAYLIDEQNRQQRQATQLPLSSESIQVRLLFKTAFLHPSVMIRTEIVRSFLYDVDFQFIEDYELWLRMKEHLLANIEEPLLYYRFHASNTHATKQQQIKAAYRVLAKRTLENYQIPYTEESFHIHALLGETSRFRDNIHSLPIAAVSGYIDQMIAWNKARAVFRTTIFEAEMLRLWKEFSLAISSQLSWRKFMRLFFHPKTLRSTSTWDKIRMLYQLLSKNSIVARLYQLSRRLLLKNMTRSEN